MRVLCVVMLWIAGLVGAHAQTIYKCRAAGGALRYQSAPCAADAKTESTRDYAPIVDSPQAARHAQDAERSTQSSRTTPGYRTNYPAASAADDRRAQRRRACVAARDDRETTLERVGMRRTGTLVRQLNERVARACADL